MSIVNNQTIFNFDFIKVAGIYLTRLDVLGQGWRAAYMATGVPGLILGLMMLMVRDTRVQRDPLKIEEEKSEVKENLEHLLSSPTKLIKTKLDDPKLKGLNILFRSVVSPFMLLMFLAAACRQDVFKMQVNLTFNKQTLCGLHVGLQLPALLPELLPLGGCRDLLLGVRHPGGRRGCGGRGSDH